MKNLYHLFSDGSLSVDLFVGESEFVDAVNRLAVVCFFTDVRILAFSIQDTHIHVLLCGPLEKVVKFKEQYQKRTRDYLSRFRKGDASVENFKLDILEVDNEEYTKISATYVICQATKDGKRVMPYDYKWSSAALYFRRTVNDLLWRTDSSGKLMVSRKMKEIPLRKQRDLFHTNSPLPIDWDVCDGLILPSSFVDVISYESIYRTHNAFRVFCGISSAKDKEVLNRICEFSGVNFDEQEARHLSKECCEMLFGFSNVLRLSAEQRIQLAWQLRKQYRMGLNQISRRVHLPEEEIRKYVK